jgi:tRNA wybutosine-synthesizing protein 2
MEMGLFDPRRSIGRDDHVRFPIVFETEDAEIGLRSVLDDFRVEYRLEKGTQGTSERIRSPTPYEQVIGRLKGIISEEDLPKVPAAYERIGDCLLLKLPGLDRHVCLAISRAYMDVLGTRYVLRDLSGTSGEFRRPDVEVLIPPENGGYEVCHREGPVRYYIDPVKILFSSGNTDERNRFPERVGSLPQPPRSSSGPESIVAFGVEIVVDMFAGIGYFSLPLAVSGGKRRIIAVEKNPVSHKYLMRNIEKNHLGETIIPVLGDNREVLPPNIADRIIMGYVGGTIDFLPRALELSRPEGCIIHLHDTIEIEKGVDTLFRRALSIANARGWDLELLDSRKVKSFAPRIDHVALDMISRPS